VLLLCGAPAASLDGPAIGLPAACRAAPVQQVLLPAGDLPDGSALEPLHEEAAKGSGEQLTAGTSVQRGMAGVVAHGGSGVGWPGRHLPPLSRSVPLHILFGSRLI
jgi:hypothetical protein